MAAVTISIHTEAIKNFLLKLYVIDKIFHKCDLNVNMIKIFFDVHTVMALTRSR